MSTSSLPSYTTVNPHIPYYTAEPQEYERRLAVNRLRPRPAGEYVKQSRGGGISLRLVAQDSNASLPVYGCGSSVVGTVEIPRSDGVTAVEVKVNTPAYDFPDIYGALFK